jgi:hypothetical protein
VTAAVFNVSNSVRDGIRRCVPEQIEGQHIGNKIDAAFVFFGVALRKRASGAR